MMDDPAYILMAHILGTYYTLRAVEPQIIQSDFPYFANLFMLSPLDPLFTIYLLMLKTWFNHAETSHNMGSIHLNILNL